MDTATPLVIRWTELVTHRGEDDGDMAVHCATADGRPVVLLLDEEHQEALGLVLVYPDGMDGEA